MTGARAGSAARRWRMAASTSPSADRGRPRTDGTRRGFLGAGLEPDDRGFFLGREAEAETARAVAGGVAAADAGGDGERGWGWGWGKGWERVYWFVCRRRRIIAGVGE